MYGDNKPPSHRDVLRAAIDAALLKKPAAFEDFVSLMRAEGYTVNTKRKHLTFLAPGWKQPVRINTLGGDYSEAAVRERVDGRRARSSGGKGHEGMEASRKPGLLIDIQAKLQQGKGPGYERWAKIFNLKQA
jgi:hypothetical protein